MYTGFGFFVCVCPYEVEDCFLNFKNSVGFAVGNYIEFVHEFY